jgi:tetratricopeptide (TPR) repeat protein
MKTRLLLIIISFAILNSAAIAQSQTKRGSSSNNSKSNGESKTYVKPTRIERARKFLVRYVAVYDTSKNEQARKAAFLGFINVANADTTNWIAQYYAGYCLSLNALYEEKELLVKEKVFQSALNYTNKAIKLAPNESEVHLLKGMINGMRIYADSTKGATLGKEVTSLFEKAKSLNPENPRVYLMLGESAMYTPKENGGGKEIAIENLELAVKKFKAFKNDDPTFPHWGADRAKEMLEKAKNL